jgi:nucleotidyltransferase/DNA polymerase involved in DNA repair
MRSSRGGEQSPVPIDSLFHTNGDISRRVLTTLEALASRVDVYSIDEAFLDLTGIDRVVSFEPLVGRRFGSRWNHRRYDTTVNACACCRLTPRNLQAQVRRRADEGPRGNRTPPRTGCQRSAHRGCRFRPSRQVRPPPCSPADRRAGRGANPHGRGVSR